MELIIGGSAILSILQSILFWNKDLGISVFIFTILGMAFLIYVLEKNNKIKNRVALLYSIPIILLSSTYFLFNNSFFKSVNIIAILGLTLVMCMYATKTKIKVPQFFENIIELIIGSLEEIQEVVKVFKIKPREEKPALENAKKLGKAILIALPIIIIVIMLLISADSIFAEMFKGITEGIKMFTISEGVLMFCYRIIIIVIVFFFLAGYLCNLIHNYTLYNREHMEKISKGIQIESITINTILTILNFIYAIFCIIQLTSLFTQVGNTTDFDYATYARKGFFQLMFVSFINFAILFIANSNKKERTKQQKNYTKGMSVIILLFTIIIILSAFYRMNLYEQQYGYTYLRLFVYYILATELAFMLPMILVILGKEIDLLKISVIIVTVMYVCINFSNIDSTIARKNVNRYFNKEGRRKIDISYLIRYTGTDAIPEIIRLLESKDEHVVERIEQYLSQEREKLEEEKMQWQEFNWSKQKARNILNNQ